MFPGWKRGPDRAFLFSDFDLFVKILIFSKKDIHWMKAGPRQCFPFFRLWFFCEDFDFFKERYLLDESGAQTDRAFRRLWNQRRQIPRLLKSIKAVVRANFICVQGQLCLDLGHFGSKSVFLFNFVYIRHSSFYVQRSILCSFVLEFTCTYDNLAKNWTWSNL